MNERAEQDVIGIPRNVFRYVDIGFPARGTTFPLDHGYALFGAVSSVVPQLHNRRDWGLHPVLGTKCGPNTLTLERASLMKIRAPVDDVGAFLPLAGKALELEGHRLRLGVPRVLPLMPTAYLKARVVTIKGFLEEETFASALHRKIALLPNLGQDPEQVEVAIGRRRVMRVGGRTIVGFAVALGGLKAQASIVVQAYGLGGRRHLGAGVFVPRRRR